MITDCSPPWTWVSYAPSRKSTMATWWAGIRQTAFNVALMAASGAVNDYIGQCRLTDYLRLVMSLWWFVINHCSMLSIRLLKANWDANTDLLCRLESVSISRWSSVDRYDGARPFYSCTVILLEIILHAAAARVDIRLTPWSRDAVTSRIILVANYGHDAMQCKL